MTNDRYLYENAFPSRYHSKEEYFRELRKELDLSRGAGDRRVSEVFDPTDDEFEGLGLGKYGFEGKGHFVKVHVAGDHHGHLWSWPITDRGLALINAVSAFKGEKVVRHVLEDHGYSRKITVMKTDDDGIVEYPFEKTTSADEDATEYYESPSMSPFLDDNPYQ